MKSLIPISRKDAWIKENETWGMRGHYEQQEGVGSRWKERPLQKIDHQDLHGEYEEREEEQKRMNVGCVNFLEKWLDGTGTRVQNHLNSDKS